LPNIGCRRRWRDTSDGLRFGEWQRNWSTAPARLNLALDSDIYGMIASGEIKQYNAQMNG